MNTSDRSMRNRIASYKSWANTKDRSARTAAARKSSHHDRFVKQAREIHPDGTEAQVEAAAEALKSAYYRELASRSAATRRIKSQLKAEAKAKRIEQILAEAEAGSDAA